MKKTIMLLAVMLLVMSASISVCASHCATEAGLNYIAKEEASGEKMQLMSETTQLDTPKNLVWNPNSKYGWIQWDVVDNCEGEYDIYIYRDGEEVADISWSGLYDYDGSGVVEIEIVADEVLTESGRYTFGVQALGDYDIYSDSEIGYSGEYNFICPKEKLATPTNVRWTEDGIIVHDPVENAGGYLYTIYNQDGDEVGGVWNVVNYPLENEGEIYEDHSEYLIEIATWEENFEVAYVSVKALTYNVEKYLSSDESKLSGAYEISEIATGITTVMDGLLNDMYDGESAEETLYMLLDYLYASDTSNVDFALSMEQDERLVEQIVELEEAYAEETGIEVNICDACDDSNYLEERGIDVNEIEIVGAALNSDEGNDISLNFSEADASISVDDLYYKNSVAVDISMEGIYDNQNLDIPVQITMPVPKGVVPERLVILHYHADGSVEEIHPAVSYKNNVPYVTFVLTSFSTFVFCNEDGNAEIEVCVQDEYWFDLTGADYGGRILGALYSDEDVLLEVQSFDASEGEDDVIWIDFETIDSGSYVKIMWWNSIASLKSRCEYQLSFIED